MGESIISAIITMLAVSTPAQSNQLKQDDGLRCVRWTWTGDVFNRKVICLEWVKKDCSHRLHKEICKLE